MVLPLDLRQQFLDIVQTPADFQPQFVGSGLIEPGFRGFLNDLKTGANRLVDDLPEGNAKPLRNRSRSVQNIIVYVQCRSHKCILASFEMRIWHQMSGRTPKVTGWRAESRRGPSERVSTIRSTVLSIILFVLMRRKEACLHA